MQRFRELKTIIISRQLFSYQSSTDPRIAMMRELFKPQPDKTPAAPSARSSSSSLTTEIPPVVESVVNLVVFDSDESSDESVNESNEDSHNAPVAPVLTSSTLADPASAMPEPLLVAVAPPLPGPVAPHYTSSLITPLSLFHGADATSTGSAVVGDNERERNDTNDVSPSTGCSSGLLPRVPPLKRQKLLIPYRTSRELSRKQRQKDMEVAWEAVKRLLASKKTKLVSGHDGLQARRSKAIECLLRLVVKNNHTFIDASKISAEAHRFAVGHGARSLRVWTRTWMHERKLPESKRGQHGKVYTVLGVPVFAAELKTYLRTEKWAMNPEKLRQFTMNELIPSAADAYLRHIVNEEMPRGLKQYMEIVLFPRIGLKVARGVSLSTARRWMRKEGFQYISHKKGLYFDGHDRPDVVDYRQETFLPAMAAHAERLVKYVVGSVENEALREPNNYVECRLVLCAHDEMTAQANDSRAKSWVLEDQHVLRKKGVGRGIHQSDIICSTVGWLREASQTLEYGKNYEGYWTGELFIKQVCQLKHSSKVEGLISISAARKNYTCFRESTWPRLSRIVHD